VSHSMLEAQWLAAVHDGKPDAVVVGWLPANEALIGWVIDKLHTLTCPVIWDPVLSATLTLSGTGLTLDSVQAGSGFDPAIDMLRALIPFATVITPSLAEARWLVKDETCDALVAARRLQQLGAHTVMITGGDSRPETSHTEGSWVTDIVVSQCNNNQPETVVLSEFAIHQRPIEQHAHGTGSQLAAALAVFVAQGERLYDALLMAALAAREALKNASLREEGDCTQYKNTVAAPLPENGDEWPLVTAIDCSPEHCLPEHCLPEYPTHNFSQTKVKEKAKDKQQANDTVCPTTAELGLYALTDNLEHLDSLLRLKVDTIQWRVKEKTANYKKNASLALQRCRNAGIPCWINDDWQLALELHPEGVHLGQEDMVIADLPALRKAGVGIGISTHTQWEIARARAINPSYIAFGPVFPPLSKQLKYPLLGVEQVRQWHKRYSSWPHTCIGGIVPANAEAVAATQIGSLAIVTCLQPGPEQENNAKALQQALKKFCTSPKYLSSVERPLIKEK
jgi:hydroxymethylpyrimidine kinase/phosphomethylpyrimidine kinase/thiamine-phosphate diphosphorylase